jgi:hypothetical protein
VSPFPKTCSFSNRQCTFHSSDDSGSPATTPFPIASMRNYNTQSLGYLLVLTKTDGWLYWLRNRHRWQPKDSSNYDVNRRLQESLVDSGKIPAQMVSSSAENLRVVCGDAYNLYLLPVSAHITYGVVGFFQPLTTHSRERGYQRQYVTPFPPTI